jgi:hypothetical protein
MDNDFHEPTYARAQLDPDAGIGVIVRYRLLSGQILIRVREISVRA